MTPAAMLLAAGFGDPEIGLIVSLIGIVGGCVMLYVVLVRRRGSVSASPARREIDAANRQQELLRRDIEKLMVELNDLARQIGTRLETQQKRLEQVIAEADQRISQMQSLAVEPPPADPADAALEQASMLISAAIPASHRAIYELMDRGMSADEIARRTGRPMGEVELIVNLRRPERKVG